MTDHASAGAPARRTRRQLLAGGTGALAAVLTAEALARPAPAAAANGDAVILGQANTETATTIISNAANDSSSALILTSNGALAVFGQNGGGVLGSGDPGVAGASQTGIGVSGQSGAMSSAVSAGVGVSGITDTVSAPGVLGENASAGGVGVSGTAAGSFGSVSWARVATPVFRGSAPLSAFRASPARPAE